MHYVYSIAIILLLITSSTLSCFNLTSVATKIGIINEADAKASLINAVIDRDVLSTIALLKAGVSPQDLRGNLDGYDYEIPLLFIAIAHGSYSMVRALIAAGVDFDEKNQDGYTAIDWATKALVDACKKNHFYEIEARRAIFDFLWHKHAQYGSTQWQCIGKSMSWI